MALKLLMNRHPDTVARVHQEVQITAAVHHDNVAETYCYLQLDRDSLLATGKVSGAGWQKYMLVVTSVLG